MTLNTRQPICPIDIPEIVDTITWSLCSADIKACLLVNRSWFFAFIRPLYENVEIVTIDSSYPVRDTQPAGLQVDYNRLPVWRSRSLGYSFRKYGFLTRSLAVPHMQGIALYSQCFVRLTHFCIAPSPTQEQEVIYTWDERAAQEPSRTWRKQDQRFKSEVIVEIWVCLINRNPGLRVVHLGLYNVRSGMEGITSALASLRGLQKVYLTEVCQANGIELLLDNCPNVQELSIESFYPMDRGERQQFRSIVDGDGGQATRIQTLSICPKTEPQRFDWIPHVLRRCPELETLALPAFYDDISLQLPLSSFDYAHL
ncbi:hypothetical protein BGX23_010954 [Mortierella sp. AD031]|nr:hypothetical protein BGX23_010954 [Mortierella sp. AD031]